jgi:hypothetical protein
VFGNAIEGKTMKTSRSQAPDVEALLTVLAMAVMASHPDFDSERFSALLMAAAMPDVGLEPATGDILARIAASTSEWAQAQQHLPDIDVTLH